MADTRHCLRYLLLVKCLYYMIVCRNKICTFIQKSSNALKCLSKREQSFDAIHYFNKYQITIIVFKYLFTKNYDFIINF